MSQPQVIGPVPDWEEHEKPSMPGSPASLVHSMPVRIAYACVAVLIGLTGGLGAGLVSANPVSYTHLDVYKRQVTGGAASQSTLGQKLQRRMAVVDHASTRNSLNHPLLPEQRRFVVGHQVLGHGAVGRQGSRIVGGVGSYRVGGEANDHHVSRRINPDRLTIHAACGVCLLYTSRCV